VKVDRYTKFVLTIIALALSTLAFKDIVAPQPAVAAAPTIQFPSILNLYHHGIPSGPSALTLSRSGYISVADVPAPSPDGQ
jgi:hypothetical protein